MVLRACPPPPAARPVPRGRPVAGRSPAPTGTSRVASGLLCGHAAANTPVGPLDHVVREAGVSPPQGSSGGGLPRNYGGGGPPPPPFGAAPRFPTPSARPPPRALQRPL